LIGFEPLKGSHSGEYMVGILYNILERFSIIKRLLCITTDNAGNNGIMQKELKELLNNLDVNNNWSSNSTKIPCLAHVIQLVVKVILGAFDIKPMTEDLDDDVKGRSKQCDRKGMVPEVMLKSNADSLEITRYVDTLL
jgi:hypothetical protein